MNDKQKPATSTQKIQDLLRREAELPDHMLGPGSLEKQKRITFTTYLILLKKRLQELDIEIMLHNAKLKFLESEEYFKNLVQIENMKNYFKILLERLLADKLRAQKLLQTQTKQLQILLYNFEVIIGVIKHASLDLTQSIDSICDEVNTLKQRLPELNNQIDRSENDNEVRELSAVYEQLQLEIIEKERLLENLRRRLDQLGNYLEAVETAVDVTLTVLEEKKCDSDQFRELIIKGNELMHDVIKNCDLESVQTIQLMDDPFAEEVVAAPRLR